MIENLSIEVEILIMFIALIAITTIIIKLLSKNDIPPQKKYKKNKIKTEKEKLMDRLIAYELKRLPHLSRKEARKTALERWERDRR